MPTNSFVRRVEQFCGQHALLPHHTACLVALSGGPDSVALLRVLQSLGMKLHAAHCNFHLRGEESDRDEAFCEQLCHRLDIPLHKAHFDTRCFATEHGLSIEMAARELRYKWFHQLLHDLQLTTLCVGHHRDDQVETILLNLTRGTGPKGLMGIHPRQGQVVRPLLCVSRQEVLDYLESIGQDFVTDSSNYEYEARRNVLRHKVIPILRSINPKFDEKVCSLASDIADYVLIKEHFAERVLQRAKVVENQFQLSVIMQSESPSAVLWHLLGQQGFRRSQIEEMMRGTTQGAVWQSHQTVAYVHRGLLCLCPSEVWTTAIPTLRLPMEGTYVVGTQGKLRIQLNNWTGDDDILHLPAVASLDASTVSFPLTIRPVQAADRFQPFGMKGTQRVGQMLTNLHCSPLERKRQLVITDASHQIIWVVGRRVSQAHAVQKGRTSRILTLTWEATVE